MAAVMNRLPDDDSRRAAYALGGDGKQTPAQTTFEFPVDATLTQIMILIPQFC